MGANVVRPGLLARPLAVTLVMLPLALASSSAVALAAESDSLEAGASTIEGVVDQDGDGLSDDFEMRWGITAVDSPDSDGDGVPDSAEDDDADGLGHLGEQLFGTDPADPDTDADGIRDGDEDSDADGVSDARDQDRRPVPPDVRPALADARDDRAAGYTNGCHSSLYEVKIHPCAYGDRDGQTHIALFGDSHMLQWLPALEDAASERGWRVTTLTKSACPSVDVRFLEPAERTERGKRVFNKNAFATCQRWRARAERWLTRQQPDLILISNRGRYRVVDGRGKPLGDKAKEVVWQAGLAKTIRALREGSDILVIADTPRLRIEPAPCLRQHPESISSCTTPRERAFLPVHDEAERAAAEANGATFRDLHDVVCSYDPCPVIIEDMLLWRDKSHLTATFARQLAPSFVAVVERALGGDVAAGVQVAESDVEEPAS